MKKTISVRLNILMYRRLQQISREAGVSLSALVEQKLSHAESEAQVRVVIEQLECLLAKVNELKLGVVHPVILEFLKEISIRLDSRIPSIVKGRLSQNGGDHE